MSLPNAIASSTVWKRSTVRIGPNVSSWTIRIDRSQWSKIVGRKKYPSARAGSVGRVPPVTSVAPSDTPRATKASILSRWAAETSGPVSAAGSVPGPIRIRRARSATAATKSSAIESWTISRVPAEHTWPECRNTPVSTWSTELSQSASAKTTCGFLPPSSTATLVTCGAAVREMVLPVASPPVKEMKST